MLQTVKISSKRQITIPSRLFQELDLHEGDSIVLKVKNKSLVMDKAQDILNSLVGSVSTPRRVAHLSTDQLITKAKKEYFAHKKIINT